MPKVDPGLSEHPVFMVLLEVNTGLLSEARRQLLRSWGGGRVSLGLSLLHVTRAEFIYLDTVKLGFLYM